MDSKEIPYYINRDKELQKISDYLGRIDTLIITGERGIGKTALTKMYERLNPLNFSQIDYYPYYSFDLDNAIIANINVLPVYVDSRLIIIDDFNEVQSIEVRNKLLNQIRYGFNNGIKLIVNMKSDTHETRRLIDNLKGSVATIELKGFTEKQSLSLIRKILIDKKLESTTLGEIKELLDTLKHNPSGIISATDLLNRDINPREILSLIHDRFTFKDKTIEEYERKIILPETPKIISDIKVINSTLIGKVQSDSKFIHSMTPRQFEEFAAELFEKEGYNVTLTQQTRDGGKDLFVVENKRFGSFIYYIECKKYSFDNPVGVRVVRELYGTVQRDRVTAGVVITSSYFSDNAKEFTEQIKTQMTLLEFSDLQKWVNELK
jgi:Restriction endonuclease